MKRESIAGLVGGVAFIATLMYGDVCGLVRGVEDAANFALAVAVGYGVFRVIAK